MFRSLVAPEKHMPSHEFQALLCRVFLPSDDLAVLKQLVGLTWKLIHQLISVKAFVDDPRIRRDVVLMLRSKTDLYSR